MHLYCQAVVLTFRGVIYSQGKVLCVERYSHVMPEGPEVRRSADYLGKLLVGKKLRSASVNRGVNGSAGGRYASADPEGLVELNRALKDTRGMTIDFVECKGKFMYWSFGGDRFMWCTYGMSGQWTTQEPDKHTALTLWVDEGKEQSLFAINFRDPRHFGTVKFVHDPDDKLTKKKLASLGPDMLKDPPTTLEFGVRLNRRRTKTIAEALMDQTVVSGVGNYIKAEALYLAEISPHRVVDTLTGPERERLREQIVNVMGASYKNNGATFRTYRNPDGTEGGAQRRFAVYGNLTDPMGNPVVKEETMDGRTTHWVPSIQH